MHVHTWALRALLTSLMLMLSFQIAHAGVTLTSTRWSELERITGNGGTETCARTSTQLFCVPAGQVAVYLAQPELEFVPQREAWGARKVFRLASVVSQSRRQALPTGLRSPCLPDTTRCMYYSVWSQLPDYQERLGGLNRFTRCKMDIRRQQLYALLCVNKLSRGTIPDLTPLSFMHTSTTPGGVFVLQTTIARNRW